MPEPIQKPEATSDKKPVVKPRPPYGTWIWYLLMTLVMLWFWQEQLRSLAVRTIPYSEFKSCLARAGGGVHGDARRRHRENRHLSHAGGHGPRRAGRADKA